MKSEQEMKKEYDDLMEEYHKAKEQGDYETALEYFEKAQKVGEVSKNE